MLLLLLLLIVHDEDKTREGQCCNDGDAVYRIVSCGVVSCRVDWTRGIGRGSKFYYDDMNSRSGWKILLGLQSNRARQQMQHKPDDGKCGVTTDELRGIWRGLFPSGRRGYGPYLLGTSRFPPPPCWRTSLRGQPCYCGT